MSDALWGRVRHRAVPCGSRPRRPRGAAGGGEVNGERERLRGLSGTGRTWAFEEWARLYRDHPVTGAVVRGLVREFEEPDGTWAAARPAAAGEPVAARGTPPAPEGGAGVRLWSSAGAAAGEADAWRRHFAGAGCGRRSTSGPEGRRAAPSYRPLAPRPHTALRPASTSRSARDSASRHSTSASRSPSAGTATGTARVEAGRPAA